MLIPDSQLKEYVEQNILPLYNSFDAAHSVDHAEYVIGESLNLAQHYQVEVNMVYTIAAYHDTGLCNGRELHHIDSGKILIADQHLRQWFTEEQLAVMRDAVEDHRASSAHPPRNIYGMIVAEADRQIDCRVTLLRTIQYGLKRYPELDREGQYGRFADHLERKYGTGGYLKLFVPQSGNGERLEQLRALIADRAQLREQFDKLFEELTTE